MPKFQNRAPARLAETCQRTTSMTCLDKRPSRSIENRGDPRAHQRLIDNLARSFGQFTAHRFALVMNFWRDVKSGFAMAHALVFFASARRLLRDFHVDDDVE